MRHVYRVTLGLVWLATASPALGQFRIAPYLQNVSTDSIHIVWWSETPTPGMLEWGRTADYGESQTSFPLPAPLSTVIAGVENSIQHPYRHEVRLGGLQTNTAYCYRVTQGMGVALQIPSLHNLTKTITHEG